MTVESISLKRFIVRLYRTYVLKDPFYLAVKKWFKDKGDQTLRLDYRLGPDSIVFDVGGYRGEWSESITKRYQPHLYIFEPVPQNFEMIQARFSGNPKIKVFNFGLSNCSEKASISLLENSSSTYKQAGQSCEIQLVDVAEFIQAHAIEEISLMKINIEGGEFALLPRLIQTGLAKKITDIQVQFHNFVPEAEALRDQIRKALSETHVLTYDYPFVWENWHLKSP